MLHLSLRFASRLLSTSSQSLARAHRPSTRSFAMTSRKIAGRYSSQSPISFYDQSVSDYAERPLQTRSLGDLLSDGNGEMTVERRIENACFVHSELPKRLARRLEDLLALPHIMVSNPHVERVYGIYAESFRDLLAVPAPRTEAEDRDFVDLLRRLVRDTVNVVEILAAGVKECRGKMERSPQRFANFDMDSFVNAMLSSRIGRRVLAEHHISLHEPIVPGYVGVVSTALRPAEVLAACVEEARDACMQNYGESPDVVWTGDVDATVPYIRFHLSYVLLELLKNAMRATVEHHRRPGAPGGAYSPLPPIEVLIVAGSENDVSLRISDRGGGVPRDRMDNIFKYGYTSAAAPNAARLNTDPSAGLGAVFASATEASKPMFGLGFGLPLSRTYVRHFGGSLDLFCIENYGTDVYLTLGNDHLQHTEV